MGNIKKQTIEFDFGTVDALRFSFEAKVENHCKRIVRMNAYTKDGAGNVTFLNCPLDSDLTIGGEVIFAKGFDLAVIYPLAGVNPEWQVCNIPIENDQIIKCSIINAHGAAKLYIVLHLEY